MKVIIDTGGYGLIEPKNPFLRVPEKDEIIFAQVDFKALRGTVDFVVWDLIENNVTICLKNPFLFNLTATVK